jgi:hypothetical protein
MVDIIYPDLLANIRHEIMARENKVVNGKHPNKRNG